MLSRLFRFSLQGSKASGLFYDFKYKLTHGAQSAQPVAGRFSSALAREEDRPLVFVFGWAGANEKNLSKYAEIYQRAGCSTMAYILPTRFIFRITEDVPRVAEQLLKAVEMEGLHNRPIFFHNMSDTGEDIFIKSESF